MRICLTGGAGFIGSHLADAFLDAGHEVVVLDDLSSGKVENVPTGARLEELDIRSDEAAALVREGSFDALVHQAAQMDVRRSVADPGFDASVNVLGTLNLLEAAIAGGVRRVLFASTGGAIYGDQDVYPATEDHPTRPLSPYGVAKLAVERYLYYYHREKGLNVVCLRYANVYGERQNPHGEAGVVAIFLERLLRGDRPRINGDGLQTRDYVHVSDVAAANVAALGLDGYHAFNVGTGRETNVVELYGALTNALGSTMKATHGPGMPGEQRRSCIDPTRLRETLGVAPGLDLPTGIQRTANWFRERAG